MSEVITSPVRHVIGLDVGDRRTHACVVDAQRNVLEEFPTPTTREGLDRRFRREPCRVVLEVGPHSRWMEKHLRGLGHEVQVVDARKVQLISKGTHKTDRRDARTLALLGAGVPELLGTIKHRSEEAQVDLAVLLTRDHFVDLRTACVNRVRGVLKSFGIKVPATSTRAFHRKAAPLVPEALQPALLPLLEEIATLNQRIAKLDDLLKKKLVQRHPAAEKLQQVPGVGILTSLGFVLSIDDPKRFKKSRDVGPFLGLTPKKHSSGESDPQLSITRCGNPFVRRLLVQSANYILGRWGPDCDLKRYGTRLIERGGKCARKRAVVAVARKLAVLLHRLWASPTTLYDPWRQLKRSGAIRPESKPVSRKKGVLARTA